MAKSTKAEMAATVVAEANMVAVTGSELATKNKMNRLMHELREPFAIHEVKFKPQATSGSKCLPICFIDARLVMDRLDQVVGPQNWKTEYVTLPGDKNVLCTLSIRVDGEWIGKSDVGGESDQKDGGDRCKSAFSDSLKRAAVHWGIGRYLYRVKLNWMDYDAQKRCIVGTPRLPAWALPGAKEAPADPYQDDVHQEPVLSSVIATETNGQSAKVSEVFAKCAAALKSAESQEQLQKYQDAYRKRIWTDDEMQALNKICAARYEQLVAQNAQYSQK